MKVKEAAHYAAMWAIRLLPLPYNLKEQAIIIASPKMLIAGIALIPDGTGRWLMLRARYSGHWIAPGGAVHPGEDALAGMLRECREELRLDVQVQQLVGIYAVRRRPLQIVAFLCRPLTALPRLSAEHETHRYLHPHQMPRRMQEILRDVHEGRPPVVRTIHG